MVFDPLSRRSEQYSARTPGRRGRFGHSPVGSRRKGATSPRSRGVVTAPRAEAVATGWSPIGSIGSMVGVTPMDKPIEWRFWSAEQILDVLPDLIRTVESRLDEFPDEHLEKNR